MIYYLYISTIVVDQSRRQYFVITATLKQVENYWL